ncbi:MAG: hypothetical protein LBS55_00105 [Prevotellaceae bacterium]|jgi:hypothetical protein|nr:hypothetical protein [Prevotellaceae bacterium]
MNDGLVNQLLDAEKIKAEIKTVTDAAIGLKQQIDETANSAITLYNALKQVSDLNGLRKATADLNKELERKSALDKEQEKMLKVLTALENQLTNIQKSATAEAKQRAGALKEEKQHQDTVTVALQKYGVAVKNNENSIKALTKQNKELRAIVSSLDMSAQQSDIDRLNAIIDENTKRIKENRDAYTQQKMTIGDYKTAISDVQVRVGNAQALLVKLADEGKKNTKEYNAAAAAMTNLNEELKGYEEGLNKAVTDSDTLNSELKKLTNEMTKLNAVGRDNWTDEQRQRFNELSKEAVELKRNISNTQKEIDILANNNLGLNTLIEAASLATAAFQTYTGVMAAAGVEDEKFKEVLMQLQGAMAVLNGLETISEKLRARSVLVTKLQTLEESKYILVRKTATAAQWALNAAQKAMPFLAAAAIIIGIIQLIRKLGDDTNAAAERQKEFNKALDEAIAKISEHSSNVNIYINTLHNTNTSIKQQQEAFKGLNKELENTGLKFNTVQEAQEWFIKNGKQYAKMLEAQASVQAHLNNYTDAYTKKQQLLGKSSRTKEENKQLKELDETIKQSTAGINLWSNVYYTAMAKMGLQSKDEISTAQKVSDLRVAAMKDGQEKELTALKNAQEKEEKEITGTAEQIAEQKKLIEQKYAIEREKINKKYAATAVSIERQLAELRIDAMNDGYTKEFQALVENEKKEKDVVLNNAQLTATQKGQLVNGITEKYNKSFTDLEKKYTKEREQINIDSLNMIAEAAKEGTERRLSTQVSSIEKQRILEKEEAQKRGKELEMTEEKIQANLDAIDAKYDKQRLDAFSDFVDAKIAKAQEEAEARARIAQEAAAVEEAALLEKYKNGEINEEQYDKGIADIRHKYAVQEATDQIDALQKILDAENLTAEQRKDIDKQLHDAKKALSDEETSHEITNIKKVNEQRKKAAEKAQDLAKQAFEMTMEFLTQQSEAKVAEFDAELERIDELMNKQLEELDNAVMSDETRAAEEKRIRDKAEADSKKIEEEKRKEQQKQAAYQKTSAIISAIISTAQSIVQTGANLGYPLAIPFQIVAGIIGAAQVALIASQPTPKYAEGIFGDESHPGGYAIVGDARKREYALTPAGKLYETPAVPTLVDMAEGTQVFPDYKTMMQYFRPEIPKYTTTDTGQYEFERMEKNIVGAIKNNKSVQHVSMNLDKNGIWLLSKNGSGKIRYINGRINQ